MNPINVYYPESRSQQIENQISSLSESYRGKYTEIITLLREGKGQNDHKFRTVSAQYVWISYMGGSKGGRIVYLKPDKDIIIWGVGPNHEIENEAKRYFTNSKIEINLLVEDRVNITHEFPTENELNKQKNETLLFAGNLSDDILRDKGLNDYLIKQVRESNLVSIWDLNNIPDHRKFEISQLAQSGTIYEARDDAHLEKFIRGDVSRLLIHLDDYQKEIINYNTDKPLLIRGETGTGKTTILIYKALYFAEDNPDKQIILFTYNISLANLIREAIEEYTENKIYNLRIEAFFEWYKEVLSIYGYSFNLIDSKTSVKPFDILSECFSVDEMSQFGYDKPKGFVYFIQSEIELVIQDFELNDLNAYLAFQRIGRNKKLGKNQRKIVWEIYQRFLTKLSTEGVHTYKTLLKNFIEIYKNRSDEELFDYDAIFLDEAQDMPPTVIKAISLLKRDEESLIWIAGDYKQAIYRKSFRWSDIELPFYGANVKFLRKNYRNSKQILDSAHGMLKNFLKEAEKPDHSGREGVSIKKFYYEGKEKFSKLKGIIDYFKSEEKIDMSDIAILTPAYISTVIKNFDKLGVKYEDVKEPNIDNNDAVKISTLHSSKGLEFRVVIIIDAQSKLVRSYEEDNELKKQQMAKLLYVGMTRAYDVCCFLLNKEREDGIILDKVFNPVKRIRVK